MSTSRISPQQYADAVKSGRPLTVNPEGLFGRVYQTYPNDPNPTARLNSHPGKGITWMVGADALQHFPETSHRRFLLDIGQKEKWLARKRDEGVRLSLLVFRSEEATPATWDGLRNAIARHYPHAASALASVWPELTETTCEQLFTAAELDELDGSKVKTDVNHPLHVSADRLAAMTKPTARDARLFLWVVAGANDLFGGKGSTGRYREYIRANSALGEHALIPLEPEAS